MRPVYHKYFYDEYAQCFLEVNIQLMYSQKVNIFFTRILRLYDANFENTVHYFDCIVKRIGPLIVRDAKKAIRVIGMISLISRRI